MLGMSKFQAIYKTKKSEDMFCNENNTIANLCNFDDIKKEYIFVSSWQRQLPNNKQNLTIPHSGYYPNP